MNNTRDFIILRLHNLVAYYVILCGTSKCLYVYDYQSDVGLHVIFYIWLSRLKAKKVNDQYDIGVCKTLHPTILGRNIISFSRSSMFYMCIGEKVLRAVSVNYQNSISYNLTSFFACVGVKYQISRSLKYQVTLWTSLSK